jgi:hypothetical protein
MTRVERLEKMAERYEFIREQALGAGDTQKAEDMQIAADRARSELAIQLRIAADRARTELAIQLRKDRVGG